MRFNEVEDPETVLARLRANKPQPPRPRNDGRVRVDPSYEQRLAAWQSEVDREERLLRERRGRA